MQNITGRRSLAQQFVFIFCVNCFNNWNSQNDMRICFPKVIRQPAKYGNGVDGYRLDANIKVILIKVMFSSIFVNKWRLCFKKSKS